MKAKGDVNPAIKWMQFIEDEKKIAQIFLFVIFLISYIWNQMSFALFVKIKWYVQFHWCVIVTIFGYSLLETKYLWYHITALCETCYVKESKQHHTCVSASSWFGSRKVIKCAFSVIWTWWYVLLCGVK